jgi:putative DNA primase/helicase
MGDVVKFEIPVASAEDLAWKELNDLGNAERLVERHRGKLCWVDGRGWVAFAGTHWSAEEGAAIATRAAQDVSRSMRDEYQALKLQIDENRLRKGISHEFAKDRLAELRKWSKTSGNANKTSAMLAQAQSLVMKRRDDFDTDPLAINCLNGTIRAVKGAEGRWSLRFGGHDPEDLISKLADVEYHPDAACPEWERHLATVLPSAAVRDFFQMVVGYALTGLRIEQVIVMLQGRGGDGKSTTMDVIRRMLGGYGMAADVQTFMAGAARSGADASPDMARLAGDVRLCSTGEPRRGGALDEAKIKAITGGSPIAARELNQSLFEFIPGFVLFLECNAKPRISGDDDGIWRRIIVILFPHQFKEGEVDKRAKERLLAELPGVFNWALRGMLNWLEAGHLTAPPEVIEAVEDYRRGANPFGEWFAERCDTSNPHALELAADLYGDYKTWCEANAVGDREMLSSTRFGTALGDRQILKGTRASDGKIRRRGARLRDRDELMARAAAESRARAAWDPGDDDGEGLP